MTQIIKDLNAESARTEELAKKTEENPNKGLRVESQEACKIIVKYKSILIFKFILRALVPHSLEF